MGKVGIVIVNYNGARYQNDCIKSLYEMTFQDFEIIIVDSCSTDNSIQMVEKTYPKVHILKQNENVGVAKGNNIGIEFSKSLGTEFTLLMNNDVVLHPQMLEKLIEQANHNRVTVPKIYYYEPKNMLWFAGGSFDYGKGTVYHLGMKETDKHQYDSSKLIEYSPTCCMLIPNHVFDLVGLMDESLFMYYDDCDFCLRLMEKGIQLYYVHDSIMWHKVSSSTGGESSPLSIYYMTRNRFAFIKKHKKMRKYAMLYSLLSNAVQFVLSPFRCKNDKYIYQALNDYFHGRMGRKDNLIKKK